MEDAYVIGIRLALENGVSAGVATIRQDLSSLDGQIASSVTALQRLAEVSATASAAALGDLKRLNQIPSRPSQSAPALLDPPLAGDNQSLARRAETVPPVSPAIPPAAPPTAAKPEPPRSPVSQILAPAPSPPPPTPPAAPTPQPLVSVNVVAPAVASPAHPGARPSAAVAAPVIPPNRLSPAPQAPAPPTPTQRAATVSPIHISTWSQPSPAAAPADRGEPPTQAFQPVHAKGPSPPPQSQQAPIIRITSPPPAQVAPPPAKVPGGEPTKARPVSLPVVSTVPAAPGAGSRNEAQSRSSHRPSPAASVSAPTRDERDRPSPSQLPATMPVSAAPQANADAATPKTPSQPAAPPATLPSVAPQTPQTANGPTSGDVYLDGTQLGTWMARHLTREASRPPSGTTGFDPRMGIAWPGTQQGG